MVHMGSSTRWRSVVNFMPQLLYHSGNNPGAHWIGGLVGLKESRDALENIKISSAWNQTPDQTTAWSLCQLGYSGSLFVSTLRTIFFTLIMPYIPPQVYTLQQAIIHTYIWYFTFINPQITLAWGMKHVLRINLNEDNKPTAHEHNNVQKPIHKK